MERTYTVPLRKEYMKVPRWRRTKKAVTALKQFLAKHMKTEDVKLSKAVNEKIWQHGIRNPPHHVKVTVSKEEGVAHAELFGTKVAVPEPEVKKSSKKEVKAEKKVEVKKEAETPKVEEAKEEKKESEEPKVEIKEVKAEETPKEEKKE